MSKFKRCNYVYIMASKSGVMYIGVTNNLNRRVSEHRIGLNDGFTKKYRCKRLVYYETTTYIINAIAREKELKKWSRYKKITLINKANPQWHDLLTQ